MSWVFSGGHIFCGLAVQNAHAVVFTVVVEMEVQVVIEHLYPRVVRWRPYQDHVRVPEIFRVHVAGKLDRVSGTGYKTQQRNGVTLQLDTTTTLDFVLMIGESAESVTVTSDANQLQPNSPDMSTEITEKEYQQLPLVQNNRLRNPASFVYLAPGVQGNIRLDGNEYTGATNVIAVNGGPIWTPSF
jgi:hypothetical protein